MIKKFLKLARGTFYIFLMGITGACGGHGSPTSPSSGGLSNTALFFQNGAEITVGRNNTDGGWIRITGNNNALISSIGDFNGATFNFYVTANGRVHKYIVEAYNSVAVVDNENFKSTFVRGIDLGDSVNFRITVEPKDANGMAQPAQEIPYSHRDQIKLVPGNLKMDGSSITGPLPPLDR